MHEDAVVEAVRARARKKKAKTDRHASEVEIAKPATSASIAQLESSLGFALNSFHRRLLTEVGNGGFGPGGGLIGTPSGTLDDSGRDLLQLWHAIKKDGRKTVLPTGVLPLCDWGDAIWSCVDSNSGRIITLSNAQLTDIETGIVEWMFDWANGVKHWDRMFELRTIEFIDPFTKRARTASVVGKAIGVKFRK